MAADTNITEWMKDAFQAMVSGDYVNFALVSCFVNGKPTAAIAAVNQDEDGMFNIHPLFVAVTEDMILTDHDGVPTQPLGG